MVLSPPPGGDRGCSGVITYSHTSDGSLHPPGGEETRPPEETASQPVTQLRHTSCLEAAGGESDDSPLLPLLLLSSVALTVFSDCFLFCPACILWC